MVDEGKVGRVPDELVNQVVCGECSQLMKDLLPDNCIDLTVTSIADGWPMPSRRC